MITKINRKPGVGLAAFLRLNNAEFERERSGRTANVLLFC